MLDDDKDGGDDDGAEEENEFDAGDVVSRIRERINATAATVENS